MGRQWLLAKREVASLRKSQATGKYLKEIMVAAKHGGADPTANARLFAAVEKAKKVSVTRDSIQRAINKGAGVGGEKMTYEHMAFEGYAPHKVAVIVEVLEELANFGALLGGELREILRDVAHLARHHAPAVLGEPLRDGMDRRAVGGEAGTGCPRGNVVVLFMAERLNFVGARFNRGRLDIGTGIGMMRLDQADVVE